MNTPGITELLGGAASLNLTMRTIVKEMKGAPQYQTDEMLDNLYEYLAVIGGSLVMLADQLDCTEEVTRRVVEGQNRLLALKANHGLEGRA